MDKVGEINAAEPVSKTGTRAAAGWPHSKHAEASPPDSRHLYDSTKQAGVQRRQATDFSPQSGVPRGRRRAARQAPKVRRALRGGARVSANGARTAGAEQKCVALEFGIAVRGGPLGALGRGGRGGGPEDKERRAEVLWREGAERNGRQETKGKKSKRAQHARMRAKRSEVKKDETRSCAEDRKRVPTLEQLDSRARNGWIR